MECDANNHCNISINTTINEGTFILSKGYANQNLIKSQNNKLSKWVEKQYPNFYLKHHTSIPDELHKLQERVNNLVEQQGENAHCAAWIYTKEDCI